MSASGPLGEFLRARRARLRPEDVGLPALRGLRREELAHLAAASVSYYTRLEQGQPVNVSDAVLNALAGAPRWDGDEREHLRELALWNDHRVRPCEAEEYRLGHPSVVAQHSLAPARSLEQSLALVTAAECSDSERALRRLARAPERRRSYADAGV